MKVLVFGAKGYLGGEFLKLYPDAIASSVDIGDCSAVGKELDENQPDVVINAAGKTGRPNIDWCEDHKLETAHSNITGPLVLLKECKERGIYWVQLGSGCIYQGDNGGEGHKGEGFTEEDLPNFRGSYYSRTKAWIDQILKEYPEDVLVLRLRMPFVGADEPRSLINKLKNYDRVLDVQNSMTYIPDLLSAAEKLIEKRATGIYNMVNSGSMSPYQIMEKYKEQIDPNHEFTRLAPEDLSEVAKTGRSNCILSGEKLQKEGIAMRSINEAVEDAFAQIKANS